jgi:hypothetical protein
MVERAGGSLRADPGVEGGRTFRVRIEDHTPYAGTLTVEDAAEEKGERHADAPTCAKLASRLAVFIAIALDDLPPLKSSPVEDTPPPAPPPPLALPPEEPALRGGLSADFLAGSTFGANTSFGAHTTVKWPRGPFGAAAAVVHENIGNSSGVSGAGTAARLGGLVAVGAPWTRSVAGFSGEIGALAGFYAGYASPVVACPAGFSLPSGCYGAGVPARWRVVSPYASASLVLQVPWKWAFRPYVSLGGLAYMGVGNDVVFVAMAQGGIAWAGL